MTWLASWCVPPAAAGRWAMRTTGAAGWCGSMTRPPVRPSPTPTTRRAGGYSWQVLGGKVFRAAIKHGDEIVDGTKDSARIIKNARQRAVRNAWKQEKEMVEITGQGTRRWTKSELKELVETGKVKGYQEHHINNVKDHPEMAGNPNNVEFLNKTEHLEAHGGNYRNMTEGPLLNRSVE